MKLRWWICWIVLLSLFPGVSRAEPNGPVYIVPLEGTVSSAQFFFLRRALKDAEQAGASAFIIDMDTPGGAVNAAMDNMDALLKTNVPTYTYINPRALSAGALIALATKKIYMAPTSVIGAAAPVLSTGDDAPKTMNDKTVSALSAIARAAAQENGHNPELADAFIWKEKEVKIGDVVIDRPDGLLTLSAQEAARVFDGKPLLATAVVPSVAALLKHANLSGELRRIEPTGFERMAFWLTTLAPLLLMGGVIGAYIEFKTPGFGLPGAASMVCFFLFFTGHYIAGLAGYEVIVAFVIGLILVLLELLVFTGTLLPGIVGALLMVGSLIWAMVDRYPNQSWWPSPELLVRPLANLGLAAVLAIIAGALLAKILPRTSFYNRLVLSAATPDGPGITIPAMSTGLALGTSGVTLTDLRPAGRAEFEGRLVDVVSQGGWVGAGQPVRVVSVEGTRVMVAPEPANAQA
ncbi:MAG: NfeD family protein [Chthoniobacteraceae bacterium]